MNAIQEAFHRQAECKTTDKSVEVIRRQLEKLTPRELEVMNHVVAGRHNRDIAQDLGTSVRTVEVHKARMMTKWNAGSVADLVRLSLGIAPPQ